MQNKAVVYSQNNCQACDSAVSLLKTKGYEVEVKKIDTMANKEEMFKIFPTARSVPKIVLNDIIKLENVAELKSYLGA